MDIELSPRVHDLKPSPTLALTARAKALRDAGQDIIGLGAGEPDFDTPEHIKAAAVAAIQAGQTKYTPVDGTLELKAAVQEKFRRENDLDYRLDQILVSCGGKHSFYNLCQALLGPGDEVVVPAPYWVSYPSMVELAGARPVIVPATQDDGFKITPERLEAALTPATRLFVLNSPSNPTGAVYSEDELRALGAVLARHPQVLIASDDIYEHILWGQPRFRNIANVCPELKERTVVLNGVSKAYSMTGWRIGYAAGPKALIQAMKNIQSQSTSNPASISQAAATAALTGDQSFIDEMKAEFKARHGAVLKGLNDLPGVRCRPADGAFYLFPDFTTAIDRLGLADDLALGEFFLERAGVALVPGSAFGAPGHLRLSFATGMEQLETALERLRQVLPA